MGKQLILIATFMVTTGLSGCATAPPEPSPQDLTNAIGSRFAGQPLQTMIERYGAPVRQMPLGDETIYTWVRENTMQFRTLRPTTVHCELDAYVTSAGIIRTIGVNGQGGACPTFMP